MLHITKFHYTLLYIHLRTYASIYKSRQFENYSQQEAQLSQRDRAAACLNFGKNISSKSVHLTLLYVTALTSTNHHITVLWRHLNATLVSI